MKDGPIGKQEWISFQSSPLITFLSCFVIGLFIIFQLVAILTSRIRESDSKRMGLLTEAEHSHNLEKEALHNQIRLELQLDRETPKIESDIGQLQQIFLNIINNAIDAIGLDGKIIITSKQIDGKHVQITVTDSGPGIESEILKHIFDPFFTTKDTGKGTGLGLPITYGLIKRLGGEIQVDSTPDKGTSFKVILPLHHPAITTGDDEVEFASSLAERLELRGFQATSANCGEDALACALSTSPHVVILDIQLPDLNGFEILDTIKESNPATEVILMTGYGSFKTGIYGVIHGAFDFLMKPLPTHLH